MTYQEVRTSWQEIHQCHTCGWQEDYSHKLDPCPKCGETDRGKYVGRLISYQPTRKDVGWIEWFLSPFTKKVDEEPPPSRWEYKDQPPMPKMKTESYIPKARIEQLQLQQDLIELLPDDFDIYLEDDKVLVRRL